MSVHEIKYICYNNMLYELAEFEDNYDQDDISWRKIVWNY